MGINFFDALKKYFAETPREKILEDWSKSEEADKVGMTITEFNKILMFNMIRNNMIDEMQEELDDEINLD